MKPIIGISVSISPPDDDRRAIAKGTELQYIPSHYLEFVTCGGGVPVLLPIISPEDGLRELVRHIDGLIISGGVDVDPQFYNESNIASHGCNPARDKAEIALINEARLQGKAVLGICRGIQVLNVAFGGTLFQDIAQTVDGALKHNRLAEEPEQFHSVMLTRRSELSEVFQVDELRVNSSHHQSIANIGRGLVVLAAAKDGVIEAVQCPDDRCTFGVQWHPERILDDPKQLRLAHWFVSQAAK